MRKIALLLGVIILLSVFVVFISVEYNDNGSSNNGKNSIDSDVDGVSDGNDAFPNDSAASLDSDSDGYPDNWNPGKTQSDSTTGLRLDDFPYDEAASYDSDKDGYPNNWNPGKDQSDSTTIPPLELDEFPDDYYAHRDSDRDGIADYYDINDNLNLSVSVSIQKFKVIKKVDIVRWAQVYFQIQIGEEVQLYDNNGRYWWTGLNKQVDVGINFEVDIPDSTDNQYTDIIISMYDYDLIGSDDSIDINKNNEDFLLLRFDNKANSIDYDKFVEGVKGELWIEITYPDAPTESEDFYERSYNWRFNNRNWYLDVQIPVLTYNIYNDMDIDRAPQNNTFYSKEMVKFVTPNDDTIQYISNELQDMALEENFDDVTTANFILRFVQENINYFSDEETKSCLEYWRFPVETLVDQKGDCEDSSVLFASIMKSLGYDTSLLFYRWEEDNGDMVGHLAVGIHLDGNYGSYVEDQYGKKYYYCETTSTGFSLGEIPNNPAEINDEPDKIIPL